MNTGQHIKHYLPLLGIIVAGLVGFKIFYYDQVFRLAVIIATSFAYITWGIINHYIHQDLDLNVILEYVAIALIGIITVAVLF